MDQVFTVQVLEWLGCAFGLAGSACLAARRPWSGIGFVLFLISNSFWSAFGVLTHANGLVLMQAGFFITSGFGAWQWLVQPRLRARREAAGAIARARAPAISA